MNVPPASGAPFLLGGNFLAPALGAAVWQNENAKEERLAEIEGVARGGGEGRRTFQSRRKHLFFPRRTPFLISTWELPPVAVPRRGGGPRKCLRSDAAFRIRVIKCERTTAYENTRQC